MREGNDTVRVFVALDLPDFAKAALEKAVRELQESLPNGIRWVEPKGVHLTLKFLGNVNASLVEEIFGAMGKASVEFPAEPIQLQLNELGVFPSVREPRVLWAGVTGDINDLARLQQLVDDSFAALGFAKERRPFRPHLTLGRVQDRVPQSDRRRIGNVISQFSLAEGRPWQAMEMHLIRSTLTPQGAIYDSLGKVSFGRDK